MRERLTRYIYLYICICMYVRISKISLRFQPFKSRKQMNRIETKKLCLSKIENTYMITEVRETINPRLTFIHMCLYMFTRGSFIEFAYRNRRYAKIKRGTKSDNLICIYFTSLTNYKKKKKKKYRMHNQRHFCTTFNSEPV